MKPLWYKSKLRFTSVTLLLSHSGLSDYDCHVTLSIPHVNVYILVPAAPSSCNITLSYSQLSGKLLFIDITWNTVSVSHLDLPSNCMLIWLTILMRAIVYAVVSRKSTHPRKSAHPLLLAQFSV